MPSTSSEESALLNSSRGLLWRELPLVSPLACRAVEVLPAEPQKNSMSGVRVPPPASIKALKRTGFCASNQSPRSACTRCTERWAGLPGFWFLVVPMRTRATQELLRLSSLYGVSGDFFEDERSATTAANPARIGGASGRARTSDQAVSVALFTVAPRAAAENPPPLGPFHDPLWPAVGLCPHALAAECSMRWQRSQRTLKILGRVGAACARSCTWWAWSDDAAAAATAAVSGDHSGSHVPPLAG
jgi:hypothetical protein